MIGIALAAAVVFTGNRQAFLYTSGLSCAAWQSDEQRRTIGNYWIRGYFSGANSFDPGANMVGQSTDSYGLIGEVNKLCNEQPSLSLEGAASMARMKLRSLRR